MFLKYRAVNNTGLWSFSLPRPNTTFVPAISRNAVWTFCLLSQQLTLQLPVSHHWQPPCASSCTCVCSRAAPSCAGSQLWCEGHPRSGSPASAACPASPSLSVPGVPCLAGGRRTGASPQSSLPSSAAGHWRCGQTQRAGSAVCLSWRRAQRPRSGNRGSLTLWRFQLQSLQTASWS